MILSVKWKTLYLKGLLKLYPRTKIGSNSGLNRPEEGANDLDNQEFENFNKVKLLWKLITPLFLSNISLTANLASSTNDLKTGDDKIFTYAYTTRFIVSVLISKKLKPFNNRIVWYGLVSKKKSYVISCQC